MGDEYIANIGAANQPPLSKIAKELCLMNYVIEREAEAQIEFRSSDKNRQPNWPADFILYSDDKTFLLTIYLTTRREREIIVRDVELALRHCGNGATFEAI